MSGAGGVRLFVAVELPVEVCETLTEWARRVSATLREAGGARGALRVLESDSLHVTLCFLGTRPATEIDVLARALESCAGRACQLSLGAPLWLPLRRPRALAVEVHDDGGQLVRVQRELRAELASVSGWSAERRRFIPHVTVARVRGAPHKREISASKGFEAQGECTLPATPRASFAPEALVLFRSQLAPEGASYEALASCRLAPR